MLCSIKIIAIIGALCVTTKLTCKSMSVTPRRILAGNWLKLVLGWILSIALRLIPFRPPNIETVLAIQMPFAKKFGFLTAFIFAFVNILLYDIITAKLGVWTVITALTYGGLALFSTWYFKNRRSTATNFALHAVFATIIYDIVTGLTIGPLFFGQSFMSAVIGQIPFTMYHLMGNVAFALTLSPLIYRFLVSNPRFEYQYKKNLVIPKPSL